MSEKPMNRILIIFLIIGFYSCEEKQKSEKKTKTAVVERTVSELKDFELLQDFEKNKAEFGTPDTFELNDHSADGGELTVFHDKKFDYVVNCGGYIDHALFNNGGRKNFENHLSALINLVEAIDRTKLKTFVNIGSSDEYGNAPAPQAEHRREGPISPYSLGKVCASHYLQTLFRTEGFPGTTVRLFLTYGPGQDSSRFLPQIIDGCTRGVSFPVSAGEQLRDFCYIDDTVTAIFLALKKPKSHGEVINVASGNPVSIREMIKTVQNIIGRGIPEFGKISYRAGENMALYDNMHPSRIIIGDTSKEAKMFGKILSDCALSNLDNSQVMYMTSKEAESVKLFSNTYLAMRISFFNELDSFAESNCLSSEKIIKGTSLDSRIGNYYNNPSFGYGGYCLPKDSKQLLRNFNSIPNKIIRATVESNQTRKDFITKTILNKQPQTVGVYRLIMKDGSDNFRESAIVDIPNNLIENNISIIIFEPLIEGDNFNGVSIIKDINYFLTSADLIIANRLTEDLEKVLYKVYTRDIFNIN